MRQTIREILPKNRKLIPSTQNFKPFQDPKRILRKAAKLPRQRSQLPRSYNKRTVDNEHGHVPRDLLNSRADHSRAELSHEPREDESPRNDRRNDARA